MLIPDLCVAGIIRGSFCCLLDNYGQLGMNPAWPCLEMYSTLCQSGMEVMMCLQHQALQNVQIRFFIVEFSGRVLAASFGVVVGDRECSSCARCC